jgi:hypothetical protein
MTFHIHTYLRALYDEFGVVASIEFDMVHLFHFGQFPNLPL